MHIKIKLLTSSEVFDSQYMDLMDGLSSDIRDPVSSDRMLGRADTFVATDELGNFIGTASIQVHELSPGSRSGHITDVIVKEEYRGRGIGSRLIRLLIQVGYKLSCTKLDLACEDHNIGFYSKSGFRSCGQHIMELDLN